MARENTIKRYIAGASYHIYNRGNNKERIFFEEKDYWVFRRHLKRALENMNGAISLLSFALLPNHYHLLISQQNERDMETFMRRLSGAYGRYISKKYYRTGNLYSGPYRAVLLEKRKDIARIVSYILANPIEAGYPEWKHVGQQL